MEGKKSNIYVNVVAPNAGTRMTRSILTPELVEAFRPEHVTPAVLLLCSDKIPDQPTGRIFEIGSGWVGEVRWQRSGGVDFDAGQRLTPERAIVKWKELSNFDDGRADYPSSAVEGASKTMRLVEAQSHNGTSKL